MALFVFLTKLGKKWAKAASKDMEKRLSRVLNSDPGMGIVRHLDAGYEIAKEESKRTNMEFPSEWE